MSTIHFIADVHVGNHNRCGGPVVGGMNTRCKEIVAALRIAAERAGEDMLVILGDLFDTPRPTPPMISAVADALKPCTGGVLVMAGNHDIASSVEWDNAISPFQFMQHTRPVVKPLFSKDFKLMIVPFNPQKGAHESIVDACAPVPLEDLNGCLLAMHAGIRDDATPGYLVSDSSIDTDTLIQMCSDWGLGGVIAGDWHYQQVFDLFLAKLDRPVRLIQCGALVPTGWDNPGIDGYGGHVSWDTVSQAFTVHEDIPGPRYITATSVDDVVDPGIAATGLRIRYRPTSDVDWSDALRKRQYVLDVVTEHSTKRSRDAARSAVDAVRMGAGLDELVAEYVKGMDVPDDQCEEIVGRVLRYLQGGE